MSCHTASVMATLRFDIITLFPGLFDSPFEESILKKARDRGLVDIAVHDLRAYAQDRHRTADDAPYGGGPGMVMKVEPVVRALEAVRQPDGSSRAVLMSPQGALFNQQTAQRLSAFDQIIIVCGRYEGVDERVLFFIDEEISLGDFVLSGGEIPAMACVDTIARLVPGVVGDPASVSEDSLGRYLLKHPQYTRPPRYRSHDVPEVLLSGDHNRIDRWRRSASLKNTLVKRPDLLRRAELTDEEKRELQQLQTSIRGEQS